MLFPCEYGVMRGTKQPRQLAMKSYLTLANLPIDSLGLDQGRQDTKPRSCPPNFNFFNGRVVRMHKSQLKQY